MPCLPTLVLVVRWCRAAGTDCGVFIILYGSGGHSGELKLENHPSNFSRGRTGDTIVESERDAGSDRSSDLIVHSLLQHMRKLQRLCIDSGCTRCLPDSFACCHHRKTWGSRHIHVATLLHQCRIFARLDQNSQTHCCCADSFTLTLPLDLGQLQRLRIGHDSKGSLPRWHLGHVVVTKKDGSMAPPVTFPCGELCLSLTLTLSHCKDWHVVIVSVCACGDSSAR